MPFLSTIYGCFWKSSCTQHFPAGSECGRKQGAAAAGLVLEKARVRIEEGAAPALGEKALKYEQGEGGKARGGLGPAELERARFPKEQGPTTDG